MQLLRWIRFRPLALLVSLCLPSGVTKAQVITEFGAGITTGAQPVGVTAGPDGNLWFTEPYVDRIGRITTGNAIFANGFDGR